jgi:hypothetical protein
MFRAFKAFRAPLYGEKRQCRDSWGRPERPERSENGRKTEDNLERCPECAEQDGSDMTIRVNYPSGTTFTVVVSRQVV